MVNKRKDLMPKFTWQRHNGYEVSSKGDFRFSAFMAIMPDGRSIEHHYQCDIKGYDPGGTDWRKGKGKPPLHKPVDIDLWDEYLTLWRIWARDKGEMLDQLAENVLSIGNGILSDCFATTDINQARALSVILNERDQNESSKKRIAREAARLRKEAKA